ncbi:DUF1926 domain-containing protein [bacterium]|nr:DUF1926 domain-containing protein [bacterium]
MSKINFMMGIHNHQPVGNFEHVFEESYQKSYYPFLNVLKDYPGVRISMHFTGPLLEWLEKNHPEIFDLIIPMVESKQIEIMGGGFYEPILSVLPDVDVNGQIDMMNSYVKKRFKSSPHGFWLAERVWEPALAGIAKVNNLKYTLLDQSHFAYSGLNSKDIHGYYITEDKGNVLNVFPISYDLRYLIPFRQVSEVEDFFKKKAHDENITGITFADDGEKFGTWPGMFDWVFNQGWLHKFFSFIENNKTWIDMPLFSEYLDMYKPEGRIYIPTASYAEMSEWSLPCDSGEKYEEMLEFLEHKHKSKEYEPFVRGGFWRNFQAKYDESNNMHKKMLEVSEKVHKMPVGKKKSEALKYLWKSQCNCPYWHGVFGGLYLNSLRFATYTNLLCAENLSDEVLHKTKTWKEIKVYDFDRDGSDEVVFSSDTLNVYCSPSRGGSIFELDYKPKNFNFSDVLTRKKEAYHRKIIGTKSGASNSDHKSIHDIVNLKEKDIDKFLSYDSYRRASLIDHFIDEDVKLKDFVGSRYEELGDFVNAEYNYKYDHKKNEIVFDREGIVKNSENFHPVHIIKRIHTDKASPNLSFHYTLSNRSDNEINLTFGSEFVFTMLAGNAPDRHYYIPGHEDIDKTLQSQGSLLDIKEVHAVDDWMKTKIVYIFKDKCKLWRFPILTVSQSEGGMEKTYQGSVLFPHWHINLQPGERWSTKIDMGIFSW